ncbi:MAG: cytidine deaminase [Actinomycetaceae bacterium]|nr:cytidine deaminase [Actinomycetaceae bacterium]MDU0969919.1 cytidine deaminase [Actinomycetaceae bacterium]
MTITPTDAELVALAAEAATHAYIPYSGFPVGAALLLEDGRVVTGCNVENAAFGSTLCAERTAVTRAVVTRDMAEVDPDNPWDRPRIEAVAIVGLKAEPCFPCGACRQVLNEFGCSRIIVSEAGHPRSYPFEKILPMSFGPEALDHQ